MSWKPIDFEGVLSLNQTVVDHLYKYLDNKEAELGSAILHAIAPAQKIASPPIIPPKGKIDIRLTDAVDALNKQVRQIRHSRVPIADSKDWQKASDKVNGALWKAVATIEECITETFQQLELIRMDEWDDELKGTIDSIKDNLLHRIDDLKWVARRLNDILLQYKGATHGKFTWPFGRVIDRQIDVHLDKSQTFLSDEAQKFYEHYRSYHDLLNKISQEGIAKLPVNSIINRLDNETPAQLEKLYKYLKLWKLNKSNQALPLFDLITSIRHLGTKEKVYLFFKEYYDALQKALFDFSRLLKGKSLKEALQMEEIEKVGKGGGQVVNEIKLLQELIEDFQNFMEDTDPKQGGWRGWLTLKRKNSLEALKKNLENLLGGAEEFTRDTLRKTVVKEPSIYTYDHDIQDTLHEMGQPLLSKQLARLTAERFVNLLKQVGELSSTYPYCVEYVGNRLGQALRADWKYQALFAIPDFHKLFSEHMGIVGPLQDRSHLNRMNKFKRYTQQIEQWVKGDEAASHVTDIDTDIHDLKGYLQDFLGQVQRLLNPDLSDNTLGQLQLSEVENQLLSYRYLFGLFFYHLCEKGREGKMMRKQFLFVDQYFEAVENLLYATNV